MSRSVRPDINVRGLFGFQASPVTTLTNTPGGPAVRGASTGAPAKEKTEVDSYSTRIVKYVPAEVIAFYLAADKLFATQQVPLTEGSSNPDVVAVVLAAHQWPFSLAVFAIALAGVPMYLKATTDRNQPVGVQIGLAMVAFVIWSYAVQGSVFAYDAKHQFYNATLASFLLLVFTFLAGFVVPGVGKEAPAGSPHAEAPAAPGS